MDTGAYVSAVRDRMVPAGYVIGTAQLPGGAALTGYRSDFRWSWMATKLHLLVIIVEATTATDTDLERFTNDALEYSKSQKGQFRGFQTGVGVIAALIAPAVDDSAKAFAGQHLVRQFGAFAWPVVVDCGQRKSFSQTGNPKIGRIYNSWMRKQIAALLPDPG